MIVKGDMALCVCVCERERERERERDFRNAIPYSYILWTNELIFIP